MPISTICAGCGKSLSVDDAYGGSRARCPACGQIYTVPYISSADANLAATSAPQPSISSATLYTAQPTTDVAILQTLPQQFWMRATDGTVYGPTDRENLDRWFKEGRVGIGYQIRQGETGTWKEASGFKPQTQANPYATPSQGPAEQQPLMGTGLHQYARADQGVLVLILGILSFLMGCGVFSIAGVIVGRSALRDIDAGLANPKDKSMVQIGYWVSVANLVLHLVAIGGGLLFFAIALVTGF